MKIKGIVMQDIICEIRVIPDATVVSFPYALGITIVLSPKGIESEQRAQEYIVFGIFIKYPKTMKIIRTCGRLLPVVP